MKKPADNLYRRAWLGKENFQLLLNLRRNRATCEVGILIINVIAI